MEYLIGGDDAPNGFVYSEDLKSKFLKATKHVIVPELQRRTRSKGNVDDEPLIFLTIPNRRKRKSKVANNENHRKPKVQPAITSKAGLLNKVQVKKKRKTRKRKQKVQKDKTISHDSTSSLITPATVTIVNHELHQDANVNEQSSSKAKTSKSSPVRRESLNSDTQLDFHFHKAAKDSRIGNSSYIIHDIDNSYISTNDLPIIETNPADNTCTGTLTASVNPHRISNSRVSNQANTYPSTDRNPKSKIAKTTKSLIERFLLLTIGSGQDCSYPEAIPIYFRNGEMFSTTYLEFISLHETIDEMSGSLDWEDWNNKCFKIQYLVHWLEKKMKKSGGTQDQMFDLCRALENQSASVVIKMKAFAANKFVLRSHTTVQLFYYCLYPVQKQLLRERDKLMNNLNWSLNLLHPPTSKADKVTHGHDVTNH